MGTDDLRLRAMIPGRFLDVDSRAKAQLPDLGGSSTLVCLVPGMSVQGGMYSSLVTISIALSCTLLSRVASSITVACAVATVFRVTAGQINVNFNVVAPNFHSKDCLRPDMPRARRTAAPAAARQSWLYPSETLYALSLRVPRVCWRLSRVLRLGRATMCPMTILNDAACTREQLHPSCAVAARRAALCHG